MTRREGMLKHVLCRPRIFPYLKSSCWFYELWSWPSSQLQGCLGEHGKHKLAQLSALVEDSLHYWIVVAVLYEDVKAKDKFCSTLFLPTVLMGHLPSVGWVLPAQPYLSPDCLESRDTFQRCSLHTSTEETKDMRKQFNTHKHHIRPNLENSISLSLVDIFPARKGVTNETSWL